MGTAYIAIMVASILFVVILSESDVRWMILLFMLFALENSRHFSWDFFCHMLVDRVEFKLNLN